MVRFFQVHHSIVVGFKLDRSRVGIAGHGVFAFEGLGCHTLNRVRPAGCRKRSRLRFQVGPIRGQRQRLRLVIIGQELLKV